MENTCELRYIPAKLTVVVARGGRESRDARRIKSAKP